MQHLAPVAMFVYNRADNTERTLQHLIANTLAKDTELYVFSDGWKRNADGTPQQASYQGVSEVRALLHRFKAEVDSTHQLRSMTIIERPENIYLERNITEGIAQVFEQHDRIIVLEDDICTSPYYLQYMNDAFNMYADVKKVMHVAGFTNITEEYFDRLRTQNVPNGLGTSDTHSIYFTPHMSGWGWGTWRDRWHEHFVHFQSEEEALAGMTADDINAMQYGGVFPCLKSLKKRPIPWDICWEIAIYKAGGLCLTPTKTMVRNIGLKNGTHFKSFDILQYYEYDREPSQEPIQLIFINEPQKDERTEAMFAEAIRDWGIRYTTLGKIVRFFYKLIIKRE